MSYLIIKDENYNISEFADKTIDEFVSYNKEYIKSIITFLYEKEGTHTDAVLLGNLICERLYSEYLFEASQELIKRNHKLKFVKTEQIYE